MDENALRKNLYTKSVICSEPEICTSKGPFALEVLLAPLLFFALKVQLFVGSIRISTVIELFARTGLVSKDSCQK